MLTTYDVTVQWYGLGTFKHCNICFIDDNAQKKRNNLEYDIIQIIFKCCESEMYLIVLLPHYKRTYDQIDQIEK